MIKKTLLFILALLILLPPGLFLAAQIWQMAGAASTPSGMTRNTAIYVPAANGTRIAVDVWLPAGLSAGDQVNTVIEGSRYWLDGGLTRLGRVWTITIFVA